MFWSIFFFFLILFRVFLFASSNMEHEMKKETALRPCLSQRGSCYVHLHSYISNLFQFLLQVLLFFFN